MRRLALSPLLLFVLVTAPVLAGPFTPTPAPVSPAGTRATVDVPANLHLRNTGGSDGPRGPGSGSGLCVFTSVELAGRWQDVDALAGFQRWMTRRPGGGYPAKLDAMLAAYCREKGVEVPDYVQHTGGDDGFLDLAVRTGRCPAVTYAGRDDFYKDKWGSPARIAHMVNLAHLDGSTAAVVDNNRPGVWVWMSRADFVTRWRDMNGGWAVVLLDPPPAPHPAAPVADGPAFGQCESGRCYPAGRAPAGPPPAGDAGRDGWVEVAFTDGTGGHKFYRGGRFVGLLDGRGWHPAAGDGWAVETAPLPADLPPLAEPPAVGSIPPGGVESARIHEAARYSTKHGAITAAEAGRLLTDDSDRWYLAAVGDGAFLARVRADADALPAAVRAKLHVHGYTPDDWHVSHFALAPGVTLRKPARGRVGAEVGAVPTAEYTAAKLDALLGSPGGPAPKATPDPLPVPTPVPTPADPQPIPWGWLVAGLLALLLLPRRKD